MDALFVRVERYVGGRGGDSNPNLHSAKVVSSLWTTGPGWLLLACSFRQGVKESNPLARVLEARSPPWRTPSARVACPKQHWLSHGVSDGSRTRLHTVTTCPRPGRVRSPKSRRLLGGRRYRRRRGGSSTSRTWFSRFSIGRCSTSAYDPGNAWSPHPDSNRHLPFTGRLLFLMSSAGLSSGEGIEPPQGRLTADCPAIGRPRNVRPRAGGGRRDGQGWAHSGRFARRLILGFRSRLVLLSYGALIVMVLGSVLRWCAACCLESFRCPGARWHIGEFSSGGPRRVAGHEGRNPTCAHRATRASHPSSGVEHRHESRIRLS